MSFKIDTIANFRDEAKRLVRKYPSLRAEIDKLGDQLSSNPKIGTPIGNSCFKIRISIASKGKGKRGGARVITYVLVTQSTVFLLSIYDKSEKSTISELELKALLNTIK